LDFDVAKIAFTASVWILPVLIAVTLHEAAHGWVAWRLGDDTAYRMGRVSFNPLKHIDAFGTVLLPAMLLLGSGGRMMFGYAKPVPVNFGGLGSPRRDMVLVALAGPVSNLILAVLSAVLMHVLQFVEGDVQQWLGYNLVNSVRINLLLCVFNMIPLPPLDGGRVAVGILPTPLGYQLARLERAGMLILLGVIFILPLLGEQIGVDLNVFWWLVGIPSEYLMDLVFTVVGIL
jgi:Zn-dependent protease